MILFETRGLQLYWVVRGGIRFAQRLWPLRVPRSMVLIDTLPRIRALVKTDQATPRSEWTASYQTTITLLAISTALRRTALLSSKRPM